jgi:hypothetical protein
VKWPSAIAALLALAEADATLTTALGGPHIYRAGEFREPRIPSVQYTVIVSTLGENFEPTLTQWDIFAAGMGQLVTAEERLRRIFHWVGWREVGGVAMASTYEASRDHPPPEPGRWHRSIDFRHQPIRHRGW